ncbi:hypothetical protein [Acanthamoeba castellanii mimivirus]|nr:hypothetical protein [Acanthamoeba polyphaga mimivirus]AKI81336.1 hypothetical protein [Acanthamoeba polyphaga mimivirus]AMK61991.1 hypothetical protein [Samba virus]BAV61784.1 hypothetical protein [Acanthamoeba castellanii mimivirus]BAV62770.1 hypothetical protein [Acanthamoeba castellanii mimivirus]
MSPKNNPEINPVINPMIVLDKKIVELLWLIQISHKQISVSLKSIIIPPQINPTIAPIKENKTIVISRFIK